jgi:hypothetical protein
MEIEEIVWDVRRGALIDVDVAFDGNLVAATFDKNGSKYLLWNEMEIKLPKFLVNPSLRFVDESRVLVFDVRTNGKSENAVIVSAEGRVVTKFQAGDGIQDVGCRNGMIFVTYFDEGIFGNVPPSQEGVAIFSNEGALIAGFMGKFGPRVDIVDCYCACWGGSESLWFCSYTGFPLVEWNLKTNHINVLKLPDFLHYPAGMSTDKSGFYFHNGPKFRDAIVRWKPGMKPEKVGSHKGPLRGLPGGRFLFLNEAKYGILTVSK